MESRREGKEQQTATIRRRGQKIEGANRTGMEERSAGTPDPGLTWVRLTHAHPSFLLGMSSHPSDTCVFVLLSLHILNVPICADL